MAKGRRHIAPVDKKQKASRESRLNMEKEEKAQCQKTRGMVVSSMDDDVKNRKQIEFVQTASQI